MTASDSNEQTNTIEPQPTPSTPAVAATPEISAPAEGAEGASLSEEAKPRILIGSQRDPAAYRPRRRDWIPIEGTEASAGGQDAQSPSGPVSAPTPAAAEHGAPAAAVEPPPTTGYPAAATADVSPPANVPPATRNRPAADLGPRGRRREGRTGGARPPRREEKPRERSPLASRPPEGGAPVPPRPTVKVPPPSVRDRLPPELEDELSTAMGDAGMDELLSGGPTAPDQEQLEPETQRSGRVLAIHGDDVFVELGGREQGILSLRQIEVPPEPGSTLEVVVLKFNPEDGLYELGLPNRAVAVDDWADINEGMLVEAQVTGSNTGGLECEVNHLRGFIPISQIALYRVEDVSQFVGQRFTCIVTEANPERRNLVLSRRAVLEREQEEARQQILQSLAPGQVRDGVVRKLLNFGAFVDIGGVDGLLHISQLAWHRVNHPSEVLSEGQQIKVKVEKVDAATGKISLAYRDLLESPWSQAAIKYLPNSVVKGKVVKLMEFGAFVELEPGVEGLLHISELSYKHVWRTSDVVKEGEEVEVMVLSVDSEAQRISLSMKALLPPPQPVKKEEDQPPAETTPPRKAKPQKPQGPLQGGLGRTGAGARFGLKW